MTFCTDDGKPAHYFSIRFELECRGKWVIEIHLHYFTGAALGKGISVSSFCRFILPHSHIVQRFGSELDIRTPTGHIGGNSDVAVAFGVLATGLGHDFCFALMLLGVEHVVLNLAQTQNTAEFL